jgi:hypothetical protein
VLLGKYLKQKSMALNQDFLSNQSDDLRRSTYNDVSADNDELGENSEQTPVANAQNQDMQNSAERRGWENNKPGITTDNENDQRIPTVTPDNENGFPGPGDDFDEEDDDDSDDELIPIETDDDDDDLLADDDDDDFLDDDDTQARAHRDISAITPNSDRGFGRTSGRMQDHEPGITNNPD